VGARRFEMQLRNRATRCPPGDRAAYWHFRLKAGLFSNWNSRLPNHASNRGLRDLVGMISTHWRKPHEPSDDELRLFDILARGAADVIESSWRDNLI
jgi:hypothetical protein